MVAEMQTFVKFARRTARLASSVSMLDGLYPNLEEVRGLRSAAFLRSAWTILVQVSDA